MKDIIRTCEPMVRFSKFTYNKKIQEKFEALLPKLEEKKKKKKFYIYELHNWV